MDKPFWLSATKLVLLTLTLSIICAPFMAIVLPAELYAGWTVVLGFYFGQKINK